jgi:hypothetical protein
VGYSQDGGDRCPKHHHSEGDGTFIEALGFVPTKIFKKKIAQPL